MHQTKTEQSCKTSCDLHITKTRNDEFLHYPTLAQQFIGFTHSMRSMMNKKNDKKWIFWSLKDGICFCAWSSPDNDVITITSLAHSRSPLASSPEKNKNIIVTSRKPALRALIAAIKMDVNEDYFIQGDTMLRNTVISLIIISLHFFYNMEIKSCV